MRQKKEIHAMAFSANGVEVTYRIPGTNGKGWKFGETTYPVPGDQDWQEISHIWYNGSNADRKLIAAMLDTDLKYVTKHPHIRIRPMSTTRRR